MTWTLQLYLEMCLLPKDITWISFFCHRRLLVFLYYKRNNVKFKNFTFCTAFSVKTCYLYDSTQYKHAQNTYRISPKQNMFFPFYVCLVITFFTQFHHFNFYTLHGIEVLIEKIRRNNKWRVGIGFGIL